MYRTNQKSSFFYQIFFIFIVAILSVHVAQAAPKNTAKPKAAAKTVETGTPNPRYAAIVIDANNGKTLYQENANARRFPASLTKMMTLYMLFEAMQAGRVAPETPIPVSKYARERPPTKIGFKPGQTINAQAAAKALITRSANDVASAVAEYLAGSEARFAKKMTAKARHLGMMNTHFANASGLPDNNNYSTARDMAILSLALREHFPQYYHLFNTTSFAFRGQTINSHNRLVRTMKGVDGIKTGWIRASGFNVATSMHVDGKSLVAVVMGGRTAASRDAHMRSLLDRHIGKASKSKKNAPALSNLVASRDILEKKQEPLTQFKLPAGKAAPVPVAKADILPEGESVMAMTNVHPVAQETRQEEDLIAQISAQPLPQPLAFFTVPEKPVTSVAQELENLTIASHLPAQPSLSDEVMPIDEILEKDTAEITFEDILPKTDKIKEKEITTISSDEPQISKQPIGDRAHDAVLIATLTRDYPDSIPVSLATSTVSERSALIPEVRQETSFPVSTQLTAEQNNALENEQEIDIFTTASVSNGKKGWVIQIATTKTVREADIALYKALTAAEGRLDMAEPYLKLYDREEERYYRARFAGFKSQKSALNACVALQENAIDCYAIED